MRKKNNIFRVSSDSRSVALFFSPMILVSFSVASLFVLLAKLIRLAAVIHFFPPICNQANSTATIPAAQLRLVGITADADCGYRADERATAPRPVWKRKSCAIENRVRRSQAFNSRKALQRSGCSGLQSVKCKRDCERTESDECERKTNENAYYT